MWQRFLIAAIGGAAITFGIFYGMSEVAQLFTQRSPDFYYRVMDFIPGADGPRRPRLVLPETPPDRPQFEFEPGEAVRLDTTPRFSDDPGVAAPPPRLEEAPVEP
jgi:hypothetical protein